MLHPITRYSIPAARAAVLVTAGLLAVTAAGAQTRAALVQSVDEPARNFYQETRANTTCRNTTVCDFNYAEVPAGKRLKVTHIAGYVDTSGGGAPNCFLGSNFGGSAYASVPFTGVRGSTSLLGTRYVLTQSILAYFGPGEQPRIFCQPSLGENMSGGAQVMLSGQFVNLP